MVAILDYVPTPVADLERPQRSSWCPPGARAIAALRQDGCRWPIGEVSDEAFRFCGGPRVRGSYCQRHRRSAVAGAAR